MSGLAQRQRQPGAAGQRRGAPSRAHHHAAVLGARAAGADLDRPAGVRPHGQDLVEGDARARSAPVSASMLARVRIAPPSSSKHRAIEPVGQQRQVLAHLSAGDHVGAHARAAHRLELALRCWPEREHAVAGEQLDAEALLVFAPERACFAGKLDQAPVVVGVAEDPRLAPGLRVARARRVRRRSPRRPARSARPRWRARRFRLRSPPRLCLHSSRGTVAATPHLGGRPAQPAVSGSVMG